MPQLGAHRAWIDVTSTDTIPTGTLLLHAQAKIQLDADMTLVCHCHCVNQAPCRSPAWQDRNITNFDMGGAMKAPCDVGSITQTQLSQQVASAVLHARPAGICSASKLQQTLCYTFKSRSKAEPN